MSYRPQKLHHLSLNGFGGRPAGIATLNSLQRLDLQSYLEEPKPFSQNCSVSTATQLTSLKSDLCAIEDAAAGLSVICFVPSGAMSH